MKVKGQARTQANIFVCKKLQAYSTRLKYKQIFAKYGQLWTEHGERAHGGAEHGWCLAWGAGMVPNTGTATVSDTVSWRVRGWLASADEHTEREHR